MPTATKRNSAPATASPTSSVKVSRSRVPREQLLQARLVDRDLAGAKPLDPLGEDVAHHDVVTELCEARAGDETDVAGAEDSDPWTTRANLRALLNSARAA